MCWPQPDARALFSRGILGRGGGLIGGIVGGIGGFWLCERDVRGGTGKGDPVGVKFSAEEGGNLELEADGLDLGGRAVGGAEADAREFNASEAAR